MRSVEPGARPQTDGVERYNRTRTEQAITEHVKKYLKAVLDNLKAGVVRLIDERIDYWQSGILLDFSVSVITFFFKGSGSGFLKHYKSSKTG